MLLLVCHFSPEKREEVEFQPQLSSEEEEEEEETEDQEEDTAGEGIKAAGGDGREDEKKSSTDKAAEEPSSAVEGRKTDKSADKTTKKKKKEKDPVKESIRNMKKRWKAKLLAHEVRRRTAAARRTIKEVPFSCHLFLLLLLTDDDHLSSPFTLRLSPFMAFLSCRSMTLVINILLLRHHLIIETSPAIGVDGR